MRIFLKPLLICLLLKKCFLANIEKLQNLPNYFPDIEHIFFYFEHGNFFVPLKIKRGGALYQFALIQKIIVIRFLLPPKLHTFTDFSAIFSKVIREIISKQIGV